MFEVIEEKQLVEPAAPARQEIVDAVAASGPATVAEIAEVLGRPPDALYYHIRRLDAVGLLVEVDRRRSGKRYESVYDLPSRNMRVRYDFGNRSATASLLRAVAAMLRLSERDFRAGVALPEAIGEGPDRNIWSGRKKAWLTKKDVRRVRRHLEAIHEIMDESRRTRHARLQAISWVLTPLNPTSRPGEGKGEKRK